MEEKKEGELEALKKKASLPHKSPAGRNPKPATPKKK